MVKSNSCYVDVPTEARGPLRQGESKDSEDASAPKVKPGKPRGLERTEGGKKLTYIYPPRRRDRLRGLGKDFETLPTDKGYTLSSPSVPTWF